MTLPTEMWIARNTEFGPPEVVKVSRAPLPKIRKNEMLIRSHATTVSAADWRLRSRQVPRGFGFIMGLIFGFRRPRYRCLGTEVAGEVIECGPRITRFKVGDRVVANLGMKLGGHAQFVTIPEDSSVTRIPDSVSFEVAAASVFGGHTALGFLRDKLKLRSGERLLVIGAGGAVGSAAVQLGKVMGAHITAVCSTEKIPFAKNLGADQVIDYRREDWRNGPSLYDVILDTAGGTGFDNAQSKLTETGRLGLVIADLPLTLSSAWKSLTRHKKAYAGSVSETAADLAYLMTLAEKGQFKPLIGDVFPLERIAEAHRRVQEGHKLGSLVIQL